MPHSRWICISAEAEMGLTQQSFASTRQNPGLTVVKNSSIICIPSPQFRPEVPLCNLHQAEVSRGNLVARQDLPELLNPSAGASLMTPTQLGTWTCWTVTKDHAGLGHVESTDLMGK